MITYFFHTINSKPHFYSTGSDYCNLHFVVTHVKLFLSFQSDYRCNIYNTSMQRSVAIKSSMWPTVENVCPLLLRGKLPLSTTKAELIFPELNTFL